MRESIKGLNELLIKRHDNYSMHRTSTLTTDVAAMATRFERVLARQSRTIRLLCFADLVFQL